MKRGWRDETAATGGCQCGSLRCAIAPSAGPGPAKSVVWHRSIRQRACGHTMAPPLAVPTERIRRDATLATRASCDRAHRGFHATCGTRMCDQRGDTTMIMAGILHPGFAFRLHQNTAAEPRQRWLTDLATRPYLATPATSHQAPV